MDGNYADIAAVSFMLFEWLLSDKTLKVEVPLQKLSILGLYSFWVIWTKGVSLP